MPAGLVCRDSGTIVPSERGVVRRVTFGSGDCRFCRHLSGISNELQNALLLDFFCCHEPEHPPRFSALRSAFFRVGVVFGDSVGKASPWVFAILPHNAKAVNRTYLSKLG